MLKISESSKSDISTVYAYYTQTAYDALPDPGMGPYGKLQKPKCKHWSCFNGTYQVGKEREFIESIASDEFSHYHISWENCN